MKYLFFDIESANSWENKGKVCSFGYVITDENFNLLAKKDIIINPRAKFDYRGFKIAGIDLAYTAEQYNNAKPFSAYYEEIKALITNKDYIICGHSTSSDAKFILDECTRYNKQPFDYIYIDTIKLLKLIYDRSKDLSLGVLYKEFYPDEEFMHMHKSDDDAFMTMKIAQHICTDKNLTFNQVISQNTLAKGEVFQGRIVDKDATIFNYSTTSNKTRNSNGKIFEQAKKEQIIDKNGKLYPKKYTIENRYENNNFAQMLLILRNLNKMGAKYVSNPAFADIYVERERNPDNELLLGKNIKTQLFSDFIKTIGLTKTDLLKKNIDCDDLIGDFESNQKWYQSYKHTHLLLQKIDSFIDGDTFECSVDFPVIQYVCQVKHKDKTTKVYRFFDPVLNGFFARHPYRVNRASNSYLPLSAYEKAQKMSQSRVIANIKRCFKEQEVIDIITHYNYIVSYKFLGSFDKDKIIFTIYEQIIADNSFEKCIKINSEAINIDLKGALMRYYNSELFAVAITTMSKFNFGYKDNLLIFEPVENIQMQENDRLHLPKRYYEEHTKTDKTMQGNIIINQGNMFIPVTMDLENNLFEEKISLPVVIERRIN